MKSTENTNAERILQDGWNLFQQKGYRGVSVDEICLKCGITKPTLYYHFKDKENLFVEVLLSRLHGFHEIIEQGGPLEARLENIVTSMLGSFTASYSHLVHDLGHIQRKENVSRIHKAFADEIYSPITALMQSAVDAGELNGDAKFLSHLFMGIVENYISHAHEFGSNSKPLAHKLVAFFLKGAG